MVTNTKHRQEFRDRVDNFIRKVIQHRRLLISTGKSVKNDTRCIRTIEHLNRQIKGQNYNNKGMAVLFLDNLDDIRYLIRDNDVDKFNTFNQLKQLSETYKYL